MSQEVRLCRLAQVLEAVLAIGSWTPWFVLRKPVQIESLRISEARLNLTLLTFLSWTGERSRRSVAHYAIGLGKEAKCSSAVRNLVAIAQIV